MPGGAGQHILLVDDEAALAQAATCPLARLGYRVTERSFRRRGAEGLSPATRRD
jgi:CheY-like chemotaxis protein